jgi:hypothetical protein
MFRKKKTKEQEEAEALAELRALPRPATDFTTPEGAILCLEDAYRQQDVDAACACKDFLIEATLLLRESAPETADDPAIQRQTAEVLQLAYRKEISANWPNMDGIETFFIERQDYDRGIVIVVEFLRFPDGSFQEANLRVAQTADGWRVLNPVGPSESSN